MLSRFLVFKRINVLLIFCLLSIYISCANEDTTVDCVPKSEVSASYNLNLPFFSSLLLPQGYVVLNPDGTNGTAGVILYNSGNGFIAYDRNAPHICPSASSSLIVEDGIKIKCPEDGAEWMLRSGEPLNEQTNGRSPRRYFVNQSGNDLIITN